MGSAFAFLSCSFSGLVLNDVTFLVSGFGPGICHTLYGEIQLDHGKDVESRILVVLRVWWVVIRRSGRFILMCHGT